MKWENLPFPPGYLRGVEKIFVAPMVDGFLGFLVGAMKPHLARVGPALASCPDSSSNGRYSSAISFNSDGIGALAEL